MYRSYSSERFKLVTSKMERPVKCSGIVEAVMTQQFVEEGEGRGWVGADAKPGPGWGVLQSVLGGVGWR